MYDCMDMSLLENHIADFRATPTESYAQGNALYFEAGNEYSLTTLQRFCRGRDIDMPALDGVYAVDERGSPLYTVREDVCTPWGSPYAVPIHIEDGKVVGTAVTRGAMERHLGQVGGWGNVELIDNPVYL